MRRALVLVLGCVAACATPPLQIIYELADGTPGQSCGVSQCSEVPMGCESVLSVRIISPGKPDQPHVSTCSLVSPNRTKDLCAINRINLDPTDLPRETLEVQVTVWPRSAVDVPETPDPDDLDCLRIPVRFDATLGFPIDLAPTPALGGHAYYHPGDTETVVTLGCTNKELINAPSCSGNDSVEVTSTVTDFETGVSVSPGLADQLNVFVGEPELNTNDLSYELKSVDAAALTRTSSMPPVWGAEVKIDFDRSACIQVLEENQATASLRCRDRITVDDTRIDIAGVRVSEQTLDEILAALSLLEVPDAGLTVGLVLDSGGNPAAGFTVGSTLGTIEYLNADRTGLSNGGKTTASGLFVSRDAPYGTTFSTFVATQLTGIGGLVKGKLTIVLFDPPAGQ